MQVDENENAIDSMDTESETESVDVIRVIAVRQSLCRTITICPSTPFTHNLTFLRFPQVDDTGQNITARMAILSRPGVSLFADPHVCMGILSSDTQ